LSTVVFEPGAASLSSSGTIRWASTCQFDAPLVNDQCPDDALREDAVLVKRDEFAENFRREAISKDDIRGRLPSKTRWGTSASGVPSALTSSAVLPKASASAWARTFASHARFGHSSLSPAS